MHDDYIPGWMFLVVGLIISIPVAGFSALQDWTRKETCRGTTIVEIGGCNEDSCGVKLSDGRFATMRQPVVGGKCQ